DLAKHRFPTYNHSTFSAPDLLSVRNPPKSKLEEGQGRQQADRAQLWGMPASGSLLGNDLHRSLASYLVRARWGSKHISKSERDHTSELQSQSNLVCR